MTSKSLLPIHESESVTIEGYLKILKHFKNLNITLHEHMSEQNIDRNSKTMDAKKSKKFIST